MAMYATPSQLAGFLQADLDTYSATQALETATAEFVRRARRRWDSTAGSWSTTATFASSLLIPYRNVTAITAVKVNGVAIAVDYTLRNGSVYRDAGFGNPYASPPDQVTVEFMYGLSVVPDDVKLAVLGCAAELYNNVSGVSAETIDDYRVEFSGTPVTAGRDWREVADYYRGLLVA